MSANILIVEDEPLIALDMEETVTRAGFRVVGVARNTSDALALLEKEQVDAAVLDANLHGESGAPIAERLRSDGIPFVAVSGYSRHQLGDWLGEFPLLGKPYSADRLVAELRKFKLSARL